MGTRKGKSLEIQSRWDVVWRRGENREYLNTGIRNLTEVIAMFFELYTQTGKCYGI